MALSTTPPPPEPPSSTTTTITATASTTTTTTETPVRSLFQNPTRPSNHLPLYSSSTRLPSNPNPNYAQLAPRPPHPQVQDSSQLLYPVASSGRGFLHRPVTVNASRSVSRPPFVFPSADQGPENLGFARPTYFMHAHAGSITGSFAAASTADGGVVPGVVKGIPVSSSLLPKVGPTVSISDRNGHTESRDKNRIDSLPIIRDRKVRISDNASLYGLCRSWMRNGSPEDSQQSMYLDAAKSLPRPLPVAVQTVNLPDIKAQSDEEDEDSVKHLSGAELLHKHVRRAKRVRSRLREARLQRISRYKTRLALLLPPMVEQQFKNEKAVTK